MSLLTRPAHWCLASCFRHWRSHGRNTAAAACLQVGEVLFPATPLHPPTCCCADLLLEPMHQNLCKQSAHHRFMRCVLWPTEVNRLSCRSASLRGRWCDAATLADGGQAPVRLDPPRSAPRASREGRRQAAAVPSAVAATDAGAGASVDGCIAYLLQQFACRLQLRVKQARQLARCRISHNSARQYAAAMSTRRAVADSSSPAALLLLICVAVPESEAPSRHGLTLVVKKVCFRGLDPLLRECAKPATCLRLLQRMQTFLHRPARQVQLL